MKNVIKRVKSVKLLRVKLLNQLNHSHKKRKDSLETRAVYTEILVVSWNLPNILKYRGSILRNMASFEIDQVLAGAFHVIMDKIEADILQIAKKWNSHVKNQNQQLYWNHTLTWVFSCKFSAYFRNTISYEDLWTANSEEYFFQKDSSYK